MSEAQGREYTLSDSAGTSTGKLTEAVHHAVTSDDATTYCGRGAMLGRSRAGIRFVALRCKSWRCPTCAKSRIEQWTTRVVAAAPTHRILLTSPGFLRHDPIAALDAMRQALPKFIRILRRQVGELAYVAAVHVDPSGYVHLHVLTRSERPPIEEPLDEAWRDLVAARATARPIYEGSGSLERFARYLFRNIARGAQHHVLGNERLVTCSRNFHPPEPIITANPGESWTFVRGSPRDLLRELIELYGCQVTAVDPSDPRRVDLTPPTRSLHMPGSSAALWDAIANPLKPP